MGQSRDFLGKTERGPSSNHAPYHTQGTPISLLKIPDISPEEGTVSDILLRRPREACTALARCVLSKEQFPASRAVAHPELVQQQDEHMPGCHGGVDPHVRHGPIGRSKHRRLCRKGHRSGQGQWAPHDGESCESGSGNTWLADSQSGACELSP